MAGKVVYEVEITGTDTAVKSLGAVESALSQGGTAAAATFGNALKSVSRDIDVIGGDLTAKVAKGMSDFLGVVEAVGSGGVLAPIAIVSAAVGGIVTLVGQWRREEEEVKNAAQDASDAHTKALSDANAWAVRVASSMEAGRKEITMQTLNMQTATIAARGLVEAQLLGEEGVLRARARTALITNRNVTEHLELTKQAEEARARVSEFRAQSEILRTQRVEEGKKFARTEANKADAADSEAARVKIDSAEKTRNEKRIADRKALMVELGKAQLDGQVKADRDVAENQAAQERDALEDRKRQQESTARYEELTAEDNKKRDENAKATSDKVTEALNKRTEAERKLAEQIEERQHKQNRADASSLMSAGVNESYAASAMVVSSAMGPLNAQLARFGTINRENWRDLLLFTEDSKAAFAAQVQAALWSLAQQAGSKATMEAGEAVKETALAFGASAIQDYGGAGLHAASAATHTVAAQVYAGIAGTSAGASVGIGMARGEGGLVGLTKEEREAKDREIGTRTAGDSAGGPVAGVGRSERAGPVVVNFVYEAGAINAQNGDAAAATVAKASSRARRDGFRRREMGG